MQPTTDGASSAVIEFEEPALEGEGASLRHDVYCILVECTRDRGLQVFRDDVQRASVDALATLMARQLAPRIGGRYVPKRDERAARDAAVWKAFTGRNHGDVMKQFDISRRLLYSILARRRRDVV